MPASPNYEFVVVNKADGKVVFRDRLRKRRCRKKGCRTWVSIGGPYCKRHARSEMGLDIETSIALSLIGVSGLGVYATRPFLSGELICRYDCERVTVEQIHERYGENGCCTYTLVDCKGYCDASLDRCIGSMFNDARRIPHAVYNAAFYDDGPAEEAVGIFATLNIAAGDEILLSYGRAYWAGHKRSETESATVLVE